MRLHSEKTRNGYLIRLFGESGEIAYLSLAVRGLCAEIEFPSDWHEHKRAWVRLGFVLFTIAFSFPWKRVVPDNYQCSGPTYGFTFFEDGLHLHWGKCNGKQDDPMKVIGMPWRWIHREHKILSEKESHPYTYVLNSGEVQDRKATIQVESRLWTRFWLPWKKLSTYIDVEFDDEVGERAGSWKGGTIGCSYDILSNETPLEALRRMETERKF